MFFILLVLLQIEENPLFCLLEALRNQYRLKNVKQIKYKRYEHISEKTATFHELSVLLEVEKKKQLINIRCYQ